MYYRSQYQCDYTPDGSMLGVRLLSYKDLLISDVSRSWSMDTQTESIIAATYRYHQARGNASMTLAWEGLLYFSGPAEAERESTLHIQRLLAARQGVLRLSSAYVGSTPTLVQDWTATLEGVTHRFIWGDDNPRHQLRVGGNTRQTWAAMSYTFTLTSPQTR